MSLLPNGPGVFTYGNWAAVNASAGPTQNGALATVGNGTLTAALINGGIIIRTGSTSAFTDTTDTAANIISNRTGSTTNSLWLVTISNQTAYAETLAAGSGVTLSPATTIIAANSTAQFSVSQTSGTAVTLTLLGSFYNQGGAGYDPSTTATQFGSSTTTFLEEGNINRQISATGVQPGATAADNVVATYTLPANSFDVSGRGIQITASGSFGATGNNKRIKIIFNPSSATVGSTVGSGGTTIADTGTVTTNGGGWQVSANVFKYGAAGSNTQLGIHAQAQSGGAVSTLLAPSTITATESGAIFIAITGNATTAASDIVFNWLEINAMN